MCGTYKSQFMKNLKTIGLSLFLCIGFIMPSCGGGGDDDLLGCDCSLYQYFDIDGITIGTYKSRNDQEPIIPMDSIFLSEFKVLHIDYTVSYHALAEPKIDWSFSLMNSANACSCIGGYSGSKTEKIKQLSIITLNDFDDQHKANESINDLFDYTGSLFAVSDTIPLTEFLSDTSENIAEEDLFLQLTKAPSLNPEFKFKVIMELSTGEVYEAESHPFYIFP